MVEKAWNKLQKTVMPFHKTRDTYLVKIKAKVCSMFVIFTRSNVLTNFVESRYGVLYCGYIRIYDGIDVTPWINTF